MRAGDASLGAASLRGLASRRAAVGSFFRASTGGPPDPQGPVALPDGLAVVTAHTRGSAHAGGGGSEVGGAGGLKGRRRSPAVPPFNAFAGVKDFSRLACLAFPSESADAFCRMGYARLQLLLGYVVPELLDEDWLSEDAEVGSQADEKNSLPAASLHVPYRPYAEKRMHSNRLFAAIAVAAAAVAAAAAVVVSLNGRDVYRSAIIRCEQAEAGGFLRGIWDERVELQVGRHSFALLLPLLLSAAAAAAAAVIAAAAAVDPACCCCCCSFCLLLLLLPPLLLLVSSASIVAATAGRVAVEVAESQWIHHPYSVLRVAVFDKDTAEAAIGIDELLGALDFQLHLLRPQQLYDISAFLPPFAVFDGLAASGKEEIFALLQATRRLHASTETEALLREQPCFEWGAQQQAGASCSKQPSNSEAEEEPLFNADLDPAAVEAAVVQQQQQEVDARCCRLRLMLQLLPHKAAKSRKIALLDELSALLLPTPQEAEECTLPPLNFPAVWTDLQDAQRKLTEGPAGVLAAGVYDTFSWERPVLSLLCLLAFVFLWMQPQFLPSALLLLVGLLLLVVSFIQMPRVPGDTSNGDEKLAEQGEAAGAAAAGSGGPWSKGSLGGPKGGPPGSLKAFEMVESSDCFEASLLRSLLSAAVPAQLQLHVRTFHHYLRQSLASYTYYHYRLCERREIVSRLSAVVGAIWVLGAWAAVEPGEACRVARYLLLATACGDWLGARWLEVLCVEALMRGLRFGSLDVSSLRGGSCCSVEAGSTWWQCLGDRGGLMYLVWARFLDAGREQPAGVSAARPARCCTPACLLFLEPLGPRRSREAGGPCGSSRRRALLLPQRSSCFVDLRELHNLMQSRGILWHR
ncbi:hypothetical protein Emag_001700 [Eimeria magna]